ncbi:helix-turn-helix domain-containing protein [Gelidibacter mesophilus]|uniref:helix-turn-helix domain-containing protein n=1 Tax=Gelidibacter mesophilus TaxID=169050 RepID=UPI00040ADF6E|nr:helix-turn-helix domain-containing protein [Gelidibacter mesophilus]
MENPFKLIESRLRNIEDLILDLKDSSRLPTLVISEDEDPKDINQIAKLTGYKPKTIYEFCRKKTIPYHKKNGRSFFFKSEIIEWIQSGEQKTIKAIESETDEFFASKKKRLK